MLNLSKTVTYEFWYDYAKPKYGKNAKFVTWIMNINFIVHVKIEGIYNNIVQDVETRFATSNVQLDKPLLKVKNKKVIR